MSRTPEEDGSYVYYQEKVPCFVFLVNSWPETDQQKRWKQFACEVSHELVACNSGKPTSSEVC